MLALHRIYLLSLLLIRLSAIRYSHPRYVSKCVTLKRYSAMCIVFACTIAGLLTERATAIEMIEGHAIRYYVQSLFSKFYNYILLSKITPTGSCNIITSCLARFCRKWFGYLLAPMCSIPFRLYIFSRTSIL